MKEQPAVCTRCKQRPPTAHGWDQLADPPRELWLCDGCWQYEQGRAALAAMQEAGIDMPEVDRSSEAEVAGFGHQLRALWVEAPEALLLEMERTEGAEQLMAFADYLRELGATTGQQPSPAVAAFLARHPPE